MISVSWLKKRQPFWARLESLLGDIKQHGLPVLGRDELREVGLLYRQTATDLSAVRGDSSSVQQTRYLNQLLGRAHNTIYSGQKKTAGRLANFFWNEYPLIFRRYLRYTLAATGIFAVGALAGMCITLSNPDFMRDFLGPQMVRTIEKHEMWTHSVVAAAPQESSFIMTNNMTVSFMTFAGGITAGLWTLFQLFFNGMLLGVIGVACGMNEMSVKLWSFVAPHGVLELPAIFIAGGAGLRLAQALLFPGILSRRDSLAVGGNEAIRLLVGIIPVLIVAGLIEGFFSPSSVPAAFKFGLAIALFALFVAYLARGWKRHSQAHPDESRDIKPGSVPSPTNID
ncbi:MAG: stage II sporulation protein M [Terriglobales bacterium]